MNHPNIETVAPRQQKQRNPNIELFRCMLMFCIVLHHCCLYIPQRDPNLSKIVSANLCFIVDAFILISGWYGVSFSIPKIKSIFCQGLFAALILYALSPLVGPPNFHFSLGWFGTSYLALLCLSPLINGGIQWLTQNGQLLPAYACYAAMMGVSWLPLHALGIDLTPPGWASGLNVNTMLFVYVTGRVIRECNCPAKRLSTRALLSIFGGLMGLNLALALLSGLTRGNPITNSFFVGIRDNNSPITLAASIALFLLFARLPTSGALRRIATFLAPSMFPIYLLHEGAHPIVARALYTKYLCPDFGIGWLPQIGSLLTAAVATFGISFLLDLIRRGALTSLRHREPKSRRRP